MKIITNEKLIRKYAAIGKYLNVASIVILLGGMAITFLRPDLFIVSMFALLVGFVMSQVSMFFINRWGRRPRPDEQISSSLKGLSNDYSLYHYSTPVSHLLVGPAGVWDILAYYQRGTITYEKNRWRQSGGGFGLAYLKIFAQEGLGRPDLDIKSDIEGLSSFFAKQLGEITPEVKPLILFTDKRAALQVEEAPIPTLRSDDLKDFIRRAAKENPISPDSLERIKSVLPQEIKNKKKSDE